MLADKALFRSDPDGLQGKATKYAGKNAIQAVCNGCESRNAGKGTALAFLANYLGFEREQVMAMGDAENDLSMLEYAYHSVAMANASPAVQKACRYQTLSNDECGVAAMIDRVLAMQER